MILDKNNNNKIKIFDINGVPISHHANIQLSIIKKLKPLLRDIKDKIAESVVSAHKTSFIIEGKFPAPLVNSGDKLLIRYLECVTPDSYLRSETYSKVILTKIRLSKYRWKLYVEEI